MEKRGTRYGGIDRNEQGGVVRDKAKLSYTLSRKHYRRCTVAHAQSIAGTSANRPLDANDLQNTISWNSSPPATFQRR